MNLLPIFPKARSIRHERTELAFASPEGRASWQSPGTFGGPFNYVPQIADLELFEQLAQVLPILPAAISKTVRLMGKPCVRGDDTLEANFEDWMRDLPVSRVQTGFGCWLETWLFDHFLYGRAHAEMILSPDFREVVAIQELHPRTIQYRLMEDGYNLEIVQQQSMGLPKTLNKRLILTATHEIRVDNPNGTSLLHGLPFVAEILKDMAWNLGQTWKIHGTPTYHVRYVPPEGLSDPNGAKTGPIATSMLNMLTGVMRSRYEGDVRHFATVGDVEIKVLGAGSDQLEYTLPARAVTEQIVARLDLPPMMLGLQWQAGERIGSEQVKVLSTRIEHLRECIEPEIRRCIDFRMALAGLAGEYNLEWEAPTLADALQQAQADAAAATAEKQEMENDKSLWKLSVINAAEFARRHRADLEGLTDEEVKARLAADGLTLMDAPPEDPVPQFGGPGQGPESGGDRPFGRSLTYGRNGGH